MNRMPQVTAGELLRSSGPWRTRSVVILASETHFIVRWPFLRSAAALRG
jgi:hypothetical protein